VKLPVEQIIASGANEQHAPGTLTLVVCNTVETAQKIFRNLDSPQTPKILLTSRFRAGDRREAEQTLQAFESCRSATEPGRIEGGDPGLICVSTQVIEAGIDISAHRLWTEHAPWPSLVQRLGRLNRDGKDNEARAIVWKPTPEDKKKYEGEDWIGPYRKTALDRASALIEALAPLSEQKTAAEALAEFRSKKPELYAEALAIPLEPCPRALDVHGLFSTEPDLHGGFTDVSRFIRNTDPDADLTVFWRDWRGGAPPANDALDGPTLDPEKESCPVAVYRLQELLKKARASAWLWNEKSERWDPISAGDLRPGMMVMLRADVGGYSPVLGWTGDGSDRLDDLPAPGPGRALRDDRRTEAGYWSQLKSHLCDARKEAERICDALVLHAGDQRFNLIRTAVIEAAGLHDLGKAHPDWQGAAPKGGPLNSEPLAKFPKVLRVEASSDDAQTVQTLVEATLTGAFLLPNEIVEADRSVRLRWALERKLDDDALDNIRGLRGVRRVVHQTFRPGLRHEAATALAMWRSHRESDGAAPYPALAVYLAATHHGKVRTVLRATTREGGDVFGIGRSPASLQFDGQTWPMDFSVASDGAEGEWTEGGFVLKGHGWTGLVADLLGPWRGEANAAWTGTVAKEEPRALGPFALAWLEALVRVADWRASEHPSDAIPPGGH
jgi:CRISPR-associated endonuclease/helicase Cas3